MQQKLISIFSSYAGADEQLWRQFEKHLSLLRYQSSILIWHDEQITPGTSRESEIDEHIESASIILLLISADFLASDYCHDIMQKALERDVRGKSRVIPILLRPCDWHSAPFAHLQALPRNGMPVTMWSDMDKAFVDIIHELYSVLKGSPFLVQPAPHLTPAQSESSLTLANIQGRRFLLNNVKRFYEIWQEKSLYEEIFIRPRLQEQPDVLDNPWRSILQELDQPSHILPHGISIVEVYHNANGELLILGQPGAGKTTLLLELARYLVTCAEHDTTHPIPVIFGLLSWSQKRQSLMDWLTEELFTKYHIPHRISKSLIDSEQILPLLDGLNEIAIGARQRCVDAINSYRRLHPLTPLVVCCRNDEYHSLTTHLSLQMAIMVQPYKIKEEWIQEGDAHAAAQRYNKALGAYNQALHLDENDHFLYYQKGCILASLDRYDEAISAFDQAIRLSPHFASAYLTKGKALQKLNRSEDALQTFLRARELGYTG